ncbi:MAG: hypothetical protein IK999_10635 [Ruminococcus sp.]|nr:hypothetical protein [Ruminococcus sp.]
MLDSLQHFNSSYGMILTVVILIIYAFVQSRTINHLKKALEQEREEKKAFKDMYDAVSEGEGNG